MQSKITPPLESERSDDKNQFFVSPLRILSNSNLKAVRYLEIFMEFTN